MQQKATKCKECSRRIEVMQEAAEEIEIERENLISLKEELFQETVRMRGIIDQL